MRSAARSFAERERGLSAISASSGVSGRRVSTRKVGGGASSSGWWREPDRCAAALDQEAFDNAILERMERHHGEPARRFQSALGGNKRARYLAELVIDENAQRLEGAGGRMDCAVAHVHDTADDLGQRARGLDRRVRRARAQWRVRRPGHGALRPEWR